MKRLFLLSGIACLMAANVAVAQAQTDDQPSLVGNYDDGTFILNEAWYGHDSGSMNFMTADGEMVYNVQELENEKLAFGATSCSGIVYGGKLYVMSKQAADPGDTEHESAGRLVVLDAKTLKLIKGFDEIGGGDGRSIVGVNPHKVYLGTSSGIVIFDVDKMEVDNVIQGMGEEGSYRVNVGDMLKAGRYVFTIEQRVGVRVIDPETDNVVETIANDDVQGIAQAADGDVWIASSTTLTRVDPATLEEKETLTLPDGVKIMCQWSAWKSTAFCASRTENVLYWNQGGSWTNGNEFYRYEIGTDISKLKPLFTIEGLPGSEEGKKQEPYGTMRYDDRTGQLVILTTQSGWGENYQYNWIHLVDGTTGELEKTITLEPYYWFQAMPIFPDKYAPEFVDVAKSVELTAGGEAYTIDLDGKVTDKDNLVYNITTSLADAGDAGVAEAELDGTTLTIRPVGEGTTTAVLTAESNGVVTEWPIEISVSSLTGINGVEAGTGTAVEVARYTLDGKKLDRPQPGVNIVRMSDGTVRKVVVR